MIHTDGWLPSPPPSTARYAALRVRADLTRFARRAVATVTVSQATTWALTEHGDAKAVAEAMTAAHHVSSIL